MCLTSLRTFTLKLEDEVLRHHSCASSLCWPSMTARYLMCKLDFLFPLLSSEYDDLHVHCTFSHSANLPLIPSELCNSANH